MTAADLLPGDDLVLPFHVKALGVRGRIVRLGASVDGIIGPHDYPASVSQLLAEAVALTALLGNSLKFDGKLILQTRTDGPADMLVSDYTTPGLVRGYARFDAGTVARLEVANEADPARLLGKGHLALTIDQGSDMDRYQGIVAVDGSGLADAAHNYFLKSEQIPTKVTMSAGPVIQAGSSGLESWRSGAIMIQHLPAEGGMAPLPLTSGDAPEGSAEPVEEDDRWRKAQALLETVEPHELLDPTLSAETLLYRLFHEDGVSVLPATQIARHCTCSRERIAAVLGRFGDEEKRDMIEDGAITVTCEFCSAQYRFAPGDFGIDG